MLIIINFDTICINGVLIPLLTITEPKMPPIQELTRMFTSANIKYRTEL